MGGVTDWLVTLISLPVRLISLSEAATASMPMTVPDAPDPDWPNSTSLSSTSSESSPAGADSAFAIGGLAFDVFGLEFPIRAVAIAVQLAVFQHLLDGVFGHTEDLGSFFDVVVFLGHCSLAFQIAWMLLP